MELFPYYKWRWSVDSEAKREPDLQPEVIFIEPVQGRE